MLVLGLQGSPRRKNSNSTYLLELLMEEARELGAETLIVDVPRRNIKACEELIVCEKKGFCPIDDDMKHEIYALLRRAEVVVMASPVFFYNVTAQLKALIDRCQTLWARRYRLKLRDPLYKSRQGFMLATAATRGKNLFEGLHLTARYFFDALDAEYTGSLTYPLIEGAGEMAQSPDVEQDIKAAAAKLMEPYQNRKRIMFACRENACRSQMAAGLAQYLGAGQLDVYCSGSEPAEKVNPDMVKIMAEKGIDMEFRQTLQLDQALEIAKPEIIVTMGCGEKCPFIPGVQMLDWDLPDPAGQGIDFMRSIRDKIEIKVVELLETLNSQK